MTTKSGWERENRVHFDEIVTNYDKVRWDYPRELYLDIFEYAGAGKKALEIGAGTGKATLPFIDAGYGVTAVELGANMAEFMAEKFKSNSGFKVINETFEEAVLENEGYDLVYAATAFHWVDASIGCPKVMDILKPGGTFALFRYNSVPRPGEALYDAIQRCYEKFYNTYYTGSKKPVRISKEEYWTPAELHRSFRFEGMEQYSFRDITMKFYEASRTYTADEYIILLDTNSDHRSLPDANRDGLYAGVREAILQYGDMYTFESLYQLYMGRKPLSM